MINLTLAKNKTYESIDMKKPILLVILCCFLNGFSQNNVDCNHLLSKEISSDLIVDPQFKIDFNNLKKCGLDEIDCEIFSNPVLLSSVAFPDSTTNSKEKLTFGKLLSKINDYKKTDFYPKIRELFELSLSVAKIENWEQDKIKFESMELNEEFLNRIHDYVLKNSDTKTYKEIFNIVGNKKSPDVSKSKIDFFKDSGNINFEDELKKATDQKKSLLILFSGYSCVNSRKMENFIVSNQQILETIQNKYHLVVLYLDNRELLPKAQQYTSPFSKKKVTTVGKKHIDLQQEKCKINYQPYFAKFDFEGNLKNSQGYTEDKNEFLKFLNKS